MNVRTLATAASGLLVIVTCSVTAAGAEGTGQSAINARPPTVTSTHCGGHISAINIRPGRGFDPLTATDSQLEANGMPARPAARSGLRLWRSYVTSHPRSVSSCAHLHADAHEFHGPVAPADPPVIPIQDSANWAGYVVTVGTYTQVTGRWVIPTASGPSPTAFAYSSSWVGIGSGNNSTHLLIQAGSQSDGNGSSARSNALWWEVFPLNSTQHGYDSTSLAGDTVVVTVTASTTKGTVTSSTRMHFGVVRTAVARHPRSSRWTLARSRAGCLPIGQGNTP